MRGLMAEMEDGEGKDFKSTLAFWMSRVRRSRSSSAVLACGLLKEVTEKWVAYKCHLNTQRG